MISTKELLKLANKSIKKDNRKRTDCEPTPYGDIKPNWSCEQVYEYWDKEIERREKADIVDPELYIKPLNLDCYDLFKLMEKENLMADAIITDPPYNVSRPNNFTTIGRAGIDFGSWDKDFDITGWIKPACSRLKKGGSIIIFNDWKNMGEIAKALEAEGLEVKDLIRWRKTNPMPRNISRRYITDFELAIWATKGDNWTFNWDRGGDSLDALYCKPEYVAPVVMGKERIHPTQKSLKVMTEIIQTHTNPGDLVLDPFFGSGTTAMACQAIGRHFIGSEINPEYFNKAVDRINNGRNK